MTSQRRDEHFAHRATASERFTIFAYLLSFILGQIFASQPVGLEIHRNALFLILSMKNEESTWPPFVYYLYVTFVDIWMGMSRIVSGALVLSICTYLV